MQSPYVVETQDLHKELKLSQEVTVHALQGVDVKITRGSFASIIGPSGSGKSTLLGLVGGLDSPTRGKVFIDGIDITDLSERRLTQIRNEKIGFVFQFFNLVPTLSALENVALPIQFARKRQFNAQQRAKELLDLLGMGDRFHHRPNQLSGGQQQRVAIARALANNPPLLLADEPTGNLDRESSHLVMEQLRQVQQKMGTTVVIVTHDLNLAQQTQVRIHLEDGKVTKIEDGQLATMEGGN